MPWRGFFRFGRVFLFPEAPAVFPEHLVCVRRSPRPWQSSGMDRPCGLSWMMMTVVSDD